MALCISSGVRGVQSLRDRLGQTRQLGQCPTTMHSGRSDRIEISVIAHKGLGDSLGGEVVGAGRIADLRNYTVGFVV